MKRKTENEKRKTKLFLEKTAGGDLCLEGLGNELHRLGLAAGLKRQLQNEQRIRLRLSPKYTRHQVCLFVCAGAAVSSRQSLSFSLHSHPRHTSSSDMPALV
jgi:hypothetical protein